MGPLSASKLKPPTPNQQKFILGGNEWEISQGTLPIQNQGREILRNTPQPSQLPQCASVSPLPHTTDIGGLNTSEDGGPLNGEQHFRQKTSPTLTGANRNLSHLWLFPSTRPCQIKEMTRTTLKTLRWVVGQNSTYPKCYNFCSNFKNVSMQNLCSKMLQSRHLQI